jgi:hypothetical protein
MLSTKIHTSFWSDDDVGALEPDQKLAVLWVLTAKDMNNIGYMKISQRQFEFDTKLPVKTLEGALKGLPRAFVLANDGGGLKVLALNFIAYQFGDTAQGEKNHITKHLCRLTAGLEDVFREAILERYPNLARVFKTLYPPSSPIEAPSIPLQAPTMPHISHQSRAEQSRAELSFQGSAEGGDYQTAQKLVAVLNSLTGSKFNPPIHELDGIVARVLETGRDVVGIEKMVRRQVALWKDDPKARNWLKIGTLFGANFHDYYGQREQAVVTPKGASQETVTKSGRPRGEILQALEIARRDGNPEEIAALEAELQTH